MAGTGAAGTGVRGARGGRPPVTSRRELERLAFELFAREGFEQTTVEDIARAAGIGRRTLFRYVSSKNDLVWGAFEPEVARLRDWFAGCPGDRPLMEAVREALLFLNRIPAADRSWHRRRIELIMTVPDLQAHAALRYGGWRQAIAEFAASRLGEPAGSLRPQVIAHAVQGAAVAAHEQWLRGSEPDVTPLLDAALRTLAAGFLDLDRR